jgi:hypothetical protein
MKGEPGHHEVKAPGEEREVFREPLLKYEIRESRFIRRGFPGFEHRKRRVETHHGLDRRRKSPAAGRGARGDFKHKVTFRGAHGFEHMVQIVRFGELQRRTIEVRRLDRERLIDKTEIFRCHRAVPFFGIKRECISAFSSVRSFTFRRIPPAYPVRLPFAATTR